MVKSIQQFFRYHFEHPNYFYFSLSLVLLLILPSIASLIIFGDVLLKLTYGLVILMACIYTSKSYRDVLLLGILGLAAFIAFLLNVQFHIISLFTPIITLSFFGLVLTRLLQHVFLPKAVSINDVLALCSGYLILGVIAAPFFFVMDLQFDNAFSIPKGADFQDLLYFSYITLTGVGYGDIVPTHPMTKSIALTLGIIGQLYLAVLVGIIIGKYLTPAK